MSNFVYLNPVAPETYTSDIVPGTSGVDLSTVTAAVFSVRKPDETELTWAATLSNQTSTTLTLTHAYAAGDVDTTGRYLVFALLTMPSGHVRTSTKAFTGKGKYEL